MSQANKMGGNIRKGEHSTTVSFWDFHSAPQADDNKDDEAPERLRPLLKLYRVFNAEQTERIDWPAIPGRPQGFDPIEAAARVIANLPNRPHIVRDAEPRAYYRRRTDIVHLPIREAFESAEAEVSLASHEVGHSTGHPSRLARFDLHQPLAAYGSADYSKEELVAELTTAFVSNEIGITTREHMNAAYIKSWLLVLMDDRAMLPQAQAGQRKPPTTSSPDPPSPNHKNKRGSSNHGLP